MCRMRKRAYQHTSFSLTFESKRLLAIIADYLGISKTAALEIAIRDKAREVSAKYERPKRLASGG